MERTTSINISMKGQDFKDLIHEILHHIEAGDEPLERLEGFEILSMGSGNIVYRKDDIVIKVGIDTEAYRAAPDQTPMREFLRPIPDGENLLRCGLTGSVPAIYAYTDAIVFMGFEKGRPLSTLRGEEYDRAYESAVTLFYEDLLYRNHICVGLTDDDILVREGGNVLFLGHGHDLFLDIPTWGRLFKEVGWIPWSDFFEKYRLSGLTL